ncbi:LCP family protein, partial [Helicobacter bizzozeronii]|uniref:LCP family protein n=1 Tax=Helicobacter bizzozeronii TaxID=56877 RepID=UPI0025560882
PERINTAYNVEDPQQDGAQRLVDTIKADFGIDINHYVAIDFASFKGVIDAVGGIPLYFHTAVRDRSTGFYQYDLGCQTLSGEQALALSRSRHFEYQTSKGWVDDPSSDLGRIARQQLVMRTAVDRASATFGDLDLKAINDIISSTSDKLTLDKKLSLGDMASLAKAFKGFSGSQIQSHTLPVYPYTTNGGAAVLKLDEAAAEPVLDLFRSTPGDSGTTTATTAPLNVSL